MDGTTAVLIGEKGRAEAAGDFVRGIAEVEHPA